jgi:hypothetical protein
VRVERRGARDDARREPLAGPLVPERCDGVPQHDAAHAAVEPALGERDEAGSEIRGAVRARPTQERERADLAERLDRSHRGRERVRAVRFERGLGSAGGLWRVDAREHDADGLGDVRRRQAAQRGAARIDARGALGDVRQHAHDRTVAQPLGNGAVERSVHAVRERDARGRREGPSRGERARDRVERRGLGRVRRREQRSATADHVAGERLEERPLQRAAARREGLQHGEPHDGFGVVERAHERRLRRGSVDARERLSGGVRDVGVVSGEQLFERGHGVDVADVGEQLDEKATRGGADELEPREQRGRDGGADVTKRLHRGVAARDVSALDRVDEGRDGRAGVSCARDGEGDLATNAPIGVVEQREQRRSLAVDRGGVELGDALSS